MQQPALHHESMIDALREDVQAIGGNKVLGSILYPEKSPEAQAGAVRDNLNPDRRERFTPDQVCLIVRLARQKGSRATMTYMARDCGFADPVMIEPEDERARLQREYIEATRALMQIASRIDSIPVRSIKAA